MIIRSERYDTGERAFRQFKLGGCHLKQHRHLGRAMRPTNGSTRDRSTRTDFSQKTCILGHTATVEKG